MNDIVPPVGAPASSGLIDRVKSILLKPAETWDVIAGEASSINSIYMGYVVILAAIGPIASMIGTSVIGVGAFGFSYHTPILLAAIEAAVTYGLGLLMVYIVALVINAFAPSFDGQKNMLAAFKVAAYSMTAGWLAAICMILPLLGWLAIAGGLYGLYLLYVGLPKLMKSPPEKSMVYVIVIIVISFLASLVPAMIAGSIGAMAGMSALGASGFHSGLGMNNPAAVNGTLNINGPDGKASINLGQMAAAASQMAAAVPTTQNGQVTTAPVKVADATALLNLMPPSFNGAARADTSTSSGGAAGMSVSTAEASYKIGDGTIRLKVSDLGSVAGLGAFANAMNLNSSSSSATGYKVIQTQGNRMTTEEYDTSEKGGDYAVVLNGRVTVDAEGSNIDMATMKALAAQVDLGRAQALTQ